MFKQAHLKILLDCRNAKAIKRVLEREEHRDTVTDVHLFYNLIENGFVDCLETELKKGADPNMRMTLEDMPEGAYFTPLMLAVISGHPDCLLLLLQYGANVKAPDSLGKTPLFYAVEMKQWKCAEVLLKFASEVGVECYIVTGLNKDVFLTYDSVKERNKAPKLHVVVEADDHVKLQQLLNRKSGINTQDVSGNTALHIAVSGGYLDCVRVLLKAKADTSILNKKGMSVLHISAEKGSVDFMQLLVKNGARVNIKGKYGVTPLHIAAREGRLECVKFLLDKGEYVDVVDEKHITPLHLAASSCEKECIKLLVQRGANILFDSSSSILPVQLALLESVECFLMLVSRSDYQKKRDYRATLIQTAAALDATALRILLDWGGDVNVCSTKVTGTPLHVASIFGNVKCVETLLEHGALVNAKDTDGSTPLHYSAEEGHVECAAALLMNGALVDDYNCKRQTPLHLAVTNGHTECARLLIRNASKVNLVNNREWTALHMSIHSEQISCFQLLLDHGADVLALNSEALSPLEMAMSESWEYFERMLQKIDINTSDALGRTVLHYAASKGEKHLKHVIEKGGNVDTKAYDGSTPLHVAAESGVDTCVKLLLKHGADVNAVDESGRTALHRGSLLGRSGCVKVLLAQGAQVNQATLKGDTALHCAAREGHLACLKLLLAHGADVKVLNSAGSTPLMAAAKKALFPCVQLLLSHDARLW